jgi:hypothetical protein
MDNVNELVLERYGFVKSTDALDNQILGDKGESIYTKGFAKHHTYVSFYQILASRDPDTQEYHLRLNRSELPEWGDLSGEIRGSVDEDVINAHLDEVVRAFKQKRGIPEEVDLQLDLEYKFSEYGSEGLSVRGTDFEKLYATLETTLIQLGYMDESIQDKGSLILRM